MPYLKPNDRKKVAYCGPMTPGELNYAITLLIRDYAHGPAFESALSYQRINDVLGALEGAKLEFYRKVAAKYEDKKCEENGEVY
jgi:hypothetical protein